MKLITRWQLANVIIASIKTKDNKKAATLVTPAEYQPKNMLGKILEELSAYVKTNDKRTINPHFIIL